MCYVVDPAKIDAETVPTVLFLDDHDRRAPWTVRGLDDSLGISSTSVLITACIAGLRARYLCLIGVVSQSNEMLSSIGGSLYGFEFREFISQKLLKTFVFLGGPSDQVSDAAMLVSLEHL